MQKSVFCKVGSKRPEQQHTKANWRMSILRFVKKCTIFSILGALYTTGFIAKAQVEPEFETTANGMFLSESAWIAIALALVSIVLLYYFFKKFTNLRAENFDVYTSHNELLVKVRVLAILSATMFPLVEYVQTQYLNLYPADWPPMLGIIAVSVFSFIVSFKKNISFSTLSLLPQACYYAIYSLVMYKLIRAGMKPAMSLEVACLVLFSKLIFPKLRQLLYFIATVAVLNAVLLPLHDIETGNLQIYLSALIQVCVVSVALYLIEGSINRKTAFGSKILESTGLFVLVANKKGEFVYVNRQLEELLGAEASKILGDGWWKYLGYKEDVTQELRQQIIDNIKQNATGNYERAVRDKHGNYVHISWDSSIIEEKYLLAVGKNVTEAKRLQATEERRKEKTGKYNQVFNELITLPRDSKTSLDDALKTICQKAAMAMGIERLGLWTLEQDRIVCDVQFVSSSGRFETGAVLYRASCLNYFMAIESGRIINAADAMNHPDTEDFKKDYFPANRIVSLLDVPIFVNGELKGVLCCEQTDTIKNWDQEDVGFVRSLADFVAISVEANKRRELEREYRYILNNAGDIIYTTDALGNFDFINKTAKRLLGYDADKVKGRHFTSIIHPEHRDKAALFYIRQFRKRTESTYYEFKVLTADGEAYWVGQNVKLITDRDNPEKVRGFQAVVRDINKQKETELALINSENNFRQINENINEVFFLYNYATQSYDYVSPNCKVLLGLDQDFFKSGKNFLDELVLDEDKEQVLEKIKNGEARQETYEIEYRVVIGGSTRWLKQRSFPILDSQGNLVKRSGVYSDITEKKLQDEQLKQLSLVAQSVSNGVVITDSHGHIEWCNQSFLNSLEYTMEEVKGRRPIEMFSGAETKAEAKEKIKGNKLENESLELLQYTKTGVPKWFMINNTPLLDEKGNVKHYVEVVTDITERKLLEKEYRYILDNAGDVIYTTNAMGMVDFLNESITKILGYKPQDLVGKHFTHIIHPEDKKMVNLFYLRQFKQKREDSYFEFRIVNVNGGVNWVGQNVKLIIDSSNPEKVKGFQAILRDITRQKETELALVESENNFRQINETITDVFYLFNIAENKYEYVSPNCSKILGVDNIYFYYVNNYISDYIIPKDRELVKEAYRKIRQGEAFEIEYRISVDNEITWIMERAYIIKDADGNAVKTSGICSNVTQKKMQEKRLLKVNKELSLYSEDLAINNLLKEQLIYTESFEEIARVVLSTVRVKIKTITKSALMLVNESNHAFESYNLEKEEVRRITYGFGDIKAYAWLTKGKKYIEHNVDLSTNLSKTDIELRKENIISYIALPISYSNKLIGSLMLGFDTPFSLSKQDIDILENFTSVLSVVVNKLSLQKELSNKTRDIIASLNYAKGIQRSILPDMGRHRDRIKNFMTLYMPKDVVSGDFYLVESFDEYTLVALGDCTGHGVPGAFLTLLGSNLLQRVAVENKVTSAAQILELLDAQLYNMLNRNRQDTIRDGMELGVCIYNSKTKQISFAGAGLFLLYYKDNEQQVVQGSKRSIGDENHSKVEFSEVVLQLNGSEKFYLFSDGYRDQLGGAEKRKRFSRARFLELLHTIKNLPPFQQEYILKLELNKHRGNYEQTDDISVIGFEFK